MISSAEFATLFDDYYPKLYSYIRSKVTNQQTAEDITATAFERAFSRSHTYDAAKGSFDTWLFTIARNLVINHYAAVERKPVQHNLDETHPVTTPEATPEQQLLQQEQYRLLTKTMAILSERDQEIIRLRFFGRLTNRKIAEIMSLKEKTVSVIIFRALKKLKTQLEAKQAL